MTSIEYQFLIAYKISIFVRKNILKSILHASGAFSLIRNRADITYKGRLMNYVNRDGIYYRGG